MNFSVLGKEIHGTECVENGHARFNRSVCYPQKPFSSKPARLGGCFVCRPTRARDMNDRSKCHYLFPMVQ